MHLVYIVRPGQNEELRYSIRSAVTNLPVQSLTIVGGAPGWVRGARHIPGNRHRSKPMNVLDNIRLAVTDPDLPDDVVIMNDDFYIMEPCDTIPVLYREPLAQHISRVRSRDWWAESLQRTATWLAEVRHTDPLSYELHTPFPMNRPLMASILDRLGDRYADNPPQWRTIYGNLAGIGGDRSADGKLSTAQGILPAGRFVSTSDVGFYMGAHRKLAALFPHRSPFETTRTLTKEKPVTLYKNKTTGQVVENTTGELDGLARWEPLEVEAQAETPMTDTEIAEAAAREDSEEATSTPQDQSEEPADEPQEPEPKPKPRARRKAAA